MNFFQFKAEFYKLCAYYIDFDVIKVLEWNDNNHFSKYKWTCIKIE